MTTLNLKKTEGGDKRIAILTATGSPASIHVCFWAARRAQRSALLSIASDGTVVWGLSELDQAIADGWTASAEELRAFRSAVMAGKSHDPFDGVA